MNVAELIVALSGAASTDLVVVGISLPHTWTEHCPVRDASTGTTIEIDGEEHNAVVLEIDPQ